MFGIVIALLGAALGYRAATKRNGSRADKVQYALVYMLIFAIIGLFVGVLFDRLN